MTIATQKAYLDYYGHHDIIPVRQDTSNQDLHFARRRALYRQLGLVPTAFRGRSVLEFGPGTGDNALYVASCQPEKYLLVDGNPASIRAVEEKLERGSLPQSFVQCQHSNILNFRCDAKFDVVLCEGVLPGQPDTEACLERVASFVAPDGLLVITTVSPAGILAEACRRVLKPFFAARFQEWDQLVRELAAFFRPDLQSLPGMSRLHEDWVLDNILHPWPQRCTFTIPEAITAIGDEFDVLGTSPSFIQDWRWHKSIPGHEQTWNDIALEAYGRWAWCFLDYRDCPGIEGGQPPAALDALCLEAIDVQHRLWQGNAPDLVPEFVSCLRSIQQTIATSAPEAARSIGDFIVGLDGLLAGNMNAAFGSFRSWFGRGQQYLSFIRKSSE
jgi:ubiquinone/menaquinone biosynthesis C-methylase UbiE